MALERDLERGAHAGGIGAGEVLVERLHESPVAAAMAGVAVPGLLQGDAPRLLVPAMALDHQVAAQLPLDEGAAAQPTLGAEELEVAPLVEGGHGEGGGDGVGELEGEDLVVHDVIVAAVDAAAPGAGARPLEDLGVGRLLGAVVHHAEPAAALGLGVEGGVVAAGVADGAAVGAARRRAGGRVLRPEVGQRAVRGEAGEGRADEPGEDVHVVAGLGEDHGRGLGLHGPVAAHERVRLVPGLHALDGVDGDEAAELAGIEDATHLGVEGRVTQDVADDDAAAEPSGGGSHGLGVLERGRDRLLEQQVVAELHGADGVAAVQGILGADHADIAQLAGGEERVGGIERPESTGGGDLGGMTGDDGDAGLHGIGGRGDGVARGHLGGDAGVGARAGAAAAEDEGKGHCRGRFQGMDFKGQEGEGLNRLMG